MTDSALTPEETTALRAAADGAVRAAADEVKLAASDRQARRHLPLLQEKMALLLSSTKAVVVRLLRRPCQATATPLELAGPLAMGEQAQGFLAGAVVQMGPQAEPLVWVGLPPLLGFHLIEVAFGAPAQLSKSFPQRNFLTPLERDTVWPTLESLARGLVRALGLDNAPSLRIVPTPYPMALDGLPTEESGVCFNAQLRLGEDTCDIGFVLAPKALDLLHEAALGAGDENKQQRAAENMLAHLQTSEVNVVAELGGTQVTVGTLADLQVGQIIWLDKVLSSPIDVLVEGQTKFTAMPMQRAGAIGVQIVTRILS